MQFKDTLRLLILSAFTCLIVFSCITVDKTIGSANIPDEYQLAVQSHSFRLPIGMKSLDSLQGYSNSYMIIGSLRTEEFGEASFGCASNISPTNTTLDFGEDPKIISIYLSIPLATATSVPTSVILDPSQKGIPQNINIYRLKTSIDTTKWFNTSLKEDEYDHTPLNKTALTYFGGDSIKVYLDNAFGAEILTATDAELDSLSLFAKKFKGLYITCDAPPAGLNGGRLNLFDANAATIFMKYNFKPTWKAGLARKDTTIALNFGYDYTLNTSSFSSKGLETDEPQEKLHIEGIGGIAPYINTQILKDSIDNWAARKGYDTKNIVIAKASLIFPFELPDNLDMISLTYPTNLFPVQRKFISDTSNIKYYYLFDDYQSPNNSYGVMNRSLMHYECDFSSTIQKLTNKDKSEIDSSYNMWVYPLMYEEDEYYGQTYYSINNINYYNAVINGPKAERYPELKIIYSVVR